MKRQLVTLVAFLVAAMAWGQDLEKVDYISPFIDGVAAVKKGKVWGFIDDSGTMVVDFRSDLVISKKDDYGYPYFNSDRCLFMEKRDGIAYFGYIDKSGKTVIEPRFLNATHFTDGWAVALELVKRRVGTNDLLEKPLVSYDYFEVIINNKGEVEHYLLDKPIHIALDKEYLRQPPKISCKVLSANLIARLNNDRSWTIKKIE